MLKQIAYKNLTCEFSNVFDSYILVKKKKFFFKQFYSVAQSHLEALSSTDLLALASQPAGVTGMS